MGQINLYQFTVSPFSTGYLQGGDQHPDREGRERCVIPLDTT